MRAIEFTTLRVNSDNQFIPVRGDTLKVKEFDKGKARIIYTATFNQEGVADAFWSLVHPRFFQGSFDVEDFQNSVRGSTYAAPSNQMPRGLSEPVKSGDLFSTIFFPNGTFAGVYGIYYDDVPNTKTRLVSASYVRRHITRTFHLDTLATATIAGDYSPMPFSVPETKFNKLERNKRYCLFGAIVGNAPGDSMIRYRHPASGGMWIVLRSPQTEGAEESINFLLDLSRDQGDLPIIPWFWGYEQKMFEVQIFAYTLSPNVDWHIYGCELDGVLEPDELPIHS